MLLHTGADVTQTDPHWACQYIDGEEAYVDRFIQLERIEEELHALERAYGLRLSDIAALSESPHHTASRMRTAGCYADADIRVDLKSPSYPAIAGFYDEGTRALVQQLFRNDFDMYGYDMTRLESLS